MADIDEKVFQYTLDFSRQAELGTDEVTLKEAIFRHMQSARTVVTGPTLERIGHVHLSILINTSVRYNLSLGEVLMEAVRSGCQPASAICSALATKKTSAKRVSKRPTLRIV
jgi:hypothetical protein